MTSDGGLSALWRLGSHAKLRDIQLASEHLVQLVAENPDQAVESVIKTLENGSVPTRVCEMIVSAFEKLPVAKFAVFIDIIFAAIGANNMPKVRNALLIVHENAIDSETALRLSIELMKVVQNGTEECFILSIFLKKWRHLLPNIESLADRILSLAISESHSYASISLLCQCYLILKQTNFADLAVMEIPRDIKIELIGRSAEMSGKVELEILEEFLTNRPESELGTFSWCEMMKIVIGKSETPEKLAELSWTGILSQAVTKETRRTIRNSVSVVLQSLPKGSAFFEKMFMDVMKLPADSLLRQDTFAMLLPLRARKDVSDDIFQQILDLLEGFHTLAVRCLSDVYKYCEVSAKLTTSLIKRMAGMQPSMQIALWKDVIQSKNTFALILAHLVDSDLHENAKMKAKLQMYTATPKFGTSGAIPVGLLHEAVISSDFEVRLSVINLICTQKKLNPDFEKILLDAIPRVFVYGNTDDFKSLEMALDMILTKFTGKELVTFVNTLILYLAKLLKPTENGVAKFYVINCLVILWKHKVVIPQEIFDLLIASLFESSQSLRDKVFDALLLMDSHAEIPLVEADIKQRIEENKQSERFREADGAARLTSLISAHKGQQCIEKHWSVFACDFARDGANVSHYNLSVIVHSMKNKSEKLSSGFVNENMIPVLCETLLAALVWIGVEADFESQWSPTVRHTWLVVRQSLTILRGILDNMFKIVSVENVQKLGDTLLQFLVRSRHYSSVYHSHLTFTSLCQHSLKSKACSALPGRWCEDLVDTIGKFSSGDHRVSGGFVHAAISLLRAEGSMKASFITHMMTEKCLDILKEPDTEDTVMSLLLLINTIATNSTVTYNKMALLRQIIKISYDSQRIELKRAANKCLISFVLKKGVDDRMSLGSQFGERSELVEFFSEHLSEKHSEISYIILKIVENMDSFVNDALYAKIYSLCFSRDCRIRKTAAKALLTLLTEQKAVLLAKELSISLMEDENDGNRVDGIVQIISEISKHYTIKEHLAPVLTANCKFNDVQHNYAIISLSSKLGYDIEYRKYVCSMLPMHEKLRLVPLWRETAGLLAKFMTDDEIIGVIKSGDRTSLLAILENLSVVSEKLTSVLLETLWNETNGTIIDAIKRILTSNNGLVKPTADQQAQFLEKLMNATNNLQKENLLSMSHLFSIDATQIFSMFEECAEFTEQDDSLILFILSKMCLDHQAVLFGSFENTVQWRIALRIISDRRFSVRNPCCRALAKQFSDRELSEYDLVKKVYENMTQQSLKLIRARLTKYESHAAAGSHFREEPVQFLMPPSCHISIIDSLLE